MIENGLKVTHTYIIDLYEARPLWWDERITRVHVRHETGYDNVKQVYLVTLSKQNNRTMSLKDFAEAEKLTSEIVNLRVAELHEMTKSVSLSPSTPILLLLLSCREIFVYKAYVYAKYPYRNRSGRGVGPEHLFVSFCTLRTKG